MSGAIRRATLVVPLLWVMVSVGCHRASPTAPGDDDLNGLWTGRVRDDRAGEGRLEIRAEIHDQRFFGSFSTSFDDPDFNVMGEVVGDITKAPDVLLVFVLQTAGRGCPEPSGKLYRADLRLQGTRMSGTYQPAFIGCPSLVGGSIELTRR
jgi:hypothetical protein